MPISFASARKKWYNILKHNPEEIHAELPPRPRFSLCGLNCGLCLMYAGGYCPGRGGNRACALAHRVQEHGELEYCFLCGEYPCTPYANRDDWDTVSFITSQRRARDMGMAACLAELGGKWKSSNACSTPATTGGARALFSLAAILPPLNDLRRTQTALIQMDAALPQRAQKAAQMLHESARIRGVALRLRKKPVDASP